MVSVVHSLKPSSGEAEVLERLCAGLPDAAAARAAEALADLPQPLAMYRERGELAGIPGVGKAIADKIEELLDTGQLQFYEKLRARLPESVLGMLRIPNLGPRTVGRLYTDLGIDSVEALRTAIQAGKLDGVKGFGAKTIAGMLQGIDLSLIHI